MREPYTASRRNRTDVLRGGRGNLLNAAKRSVKSRLDDVESKYIPSEQKSLKDRVGGNGRLCKKLVCGTAVVTILFSLAGCGGRHSSDDLADKLDTENAIADYITEQVTTECSNILYDDGKPISVLIVNGQANITIRTYADFCIPAAAEDLLPVVSEALEENGTDFGKVSVTYYRTNNSGVVEGSMVDWTTRDGKKGTFASELDDVMHTGYTVKDLQEYYKDFDELLEKLRSGEE